MNKVHYISIAIASLTLSGCVTPQQRAALHKDYLESIEIAKKSFNKEHEQVCIKEFKSRMHDPDSLKLAGSFYFNDIITEVNFPMWRTVAFSTQMRGKNSFGGQMLSTLNCEYHVNLLSKKMTYTRSDTSR